MLSALLHPSTPERATQSFQLGVDESTSFRRGRALQGWKPTVCYVMDLPSGYRTRELLSSQPRSSEEGGVTDFVQDQMIKTRQGVDLRTSPLLPEVVVDRTDQRLEPTHGDPIQVEVGIGLLPEMPFANGDLRMPRLLQDFSRHRMLPFAGFPTVRPVRSKASGPDRTGSPDPWTGPD